MEPNSSVINGSLAPSSVNIDVDTLFGTGRMMLSEYNIMDQRKFHRFNYSYSKREMTYLVRKGVDGGEGEKVGGGDEQQLACMSRIAKQSSELS